VWFPGPGAAALAGEPMRSSRNPLSQGERILVQTAALARPTPFGHNGAVKDSQKREDLDARLRRDPRRDPTDPPPPNEDEPVPPKVQIVDTSQPPPPEKPPAENAMPASARTPKVEDDEPPSRRRPAPMPPRDQSPARQPGAGSVITSSDPRIPELEKALASGNWDEALKLLGTPADSGRLPPNLGVLFAIAMKEKDREDMPTAELNDVAIRCTAGLLGVAHDSPIALLIAKRLLRRNPVALHKRPAPRPTISILIIVCTLIITGTLSWLISFGYLQFSFHLP